MNYLKGIKKKQKKSQASLVQEGLQELPPRNSQ